MIHMVIDNVNCNASQYLNKDTLVLHDVMYEIDDEHPIRPQINLSQQQVKGLPLKDHSLAIIMSKLQKNKVCLTPLLNTYFLKKEGALYQSVREDLQTYEAMLVLSKLQQLVLTTTHNQLGHNGTTILYNYIKWFYFWQKLKQDCTKHVCKCKDYQQVSLKSQHNIVSKLIMPKVTMACISVDLLGDCNEMMQCHHYALTVICMLNSFVEVIPIEDRKTETVIKGIPNI